jgi:hypothetical protein
MFEAYSVRMPSNPWGHYMLGISAWRAGDHEGAESALRRAVEVNCPRVSVIALWMASVAASSRYW